MQRCPLKRRILHSNMPCKSHCRRASQELVPQKHCALPQDLQLDAAALKIHHLPHLPSVVRVEPFRFLGLKDCARLAASCRSMQSVWTHALGSEIMCNTVAAEADERVAIPNNGKTRENERVVIDAVLRASQKHSMRSGSSLVQASVNRALCALIDTSNAVGGSACTTIIAMGGIYVVLQLMRNYPDDGIIQRGACSTLARMTTGPFECAMEHHSRIALEAGCLPLIFKAMDVHRGSLPVLSNACHALNSLSYGDENSKIMLESRAITRIIAAMRTFPKSSGLLYWACSALWVNAFSTKHGPDAVVRAGGIEQCIFVADSSTDPAIIEQACFVLAEISKQSRHIPHLRLAGAVEILKRSSAHLARHEYTTDVPFSSVIEILDPSSVAPVT